MNGLDDSATTPSSTPAPLPGDTDGSRPRRPVWVIVVGLAITLPVLAVAGFAGWLKLSGTPLIDEWFCSEGEVPTLVEGGGSRCVTPSTPLDADERLDPFGNRPFQCHDRWGWTEVYLENPPVPHDGWATDCVREGTTPPEGWVPVPDGWESHEDLPVGG